MSEERRSQVNALLDKEWGTVGGSTTVVSFPRSMKRGAKVRRGPCAKVLQFPAQLSGEELQAQFNWMRSNRDKWENEQTEGFEHRSDGSRRLEILVRAQHGLAPISDAAKRQRIAEGREQIEKRNRVKDWLESLGADLDSFGAIRPAELALFFVFDRMRTRDLPSIA
jgi:hypothetical protein